METTSEFRRIDIDLSPAECISNESRSPPPRFSGTSGCSKIGSSGDGQSQHSYRHHDQRLPVVSDKKDDDNSRINSQITNKYNKDNPRDATETMVRIAGCIP